MEKLKSSAISEKNSTNGHCRKVVFISTIMFFVITSTCLFAAPFEISALNSLGETLVGALSSTWLKAILATALVIEFGVAAWGQSKGASEMVSGAVKWMFATGGMLGATGIANFIFDEVEVEDIATSMIMNVLPSLA